MTARAQVEADWTADGVAIYLGRKTGDLSITYQPVELQQVVQTGDAAYAVMEPALRMPEDLARALLDALAAHFGGHSETQTLRRDYEAERARVDRMIAYLTAPQSVITPHS